MDGGLEGEADEGGGYVPGIGAGVVGLMAEAGDSVAVGG